MGFFKNNGLNVEITALTSGAAVTAAVIGGSVDIATIDPWNVPGRYGWVGGTGTSAHIVPSTGTIAILLTQVAADSPVPPEWMRDFWRYAAST